MKGLALSFALALSLTACAMGPDKDMANTIYEKYENHCREHSREIVGEVDEESRYQECMNYFVTRDIHCPTCVIDPHLK